MTYIKTGINQPGIVELLLYKGSTGEALINLAHTLLHGPSGLSFGERELIAAYVSKLNHCHFCYNSHAAAAATHLDDDGNTIKGIIKNLDEADIDEKMKALLKIAGKVQKSGKSVGLKDVKKVIEAGGSEEDVHDTVLISAAFCMYNRYVDGLGTRLAKDKNFHELGKILTKRGLKYTTLFLQMFSNRGPSLP